MNAPESHRRVEGSLALALLGLTLGCIAPAFGEGTPARDHENATQAAVAAWVPTGNLNVARGSHTATLLPNGKVLVAGGTDISGNILDSAELYDTNTGTWSVTGRLNAAHAGHTATLLANGKVLVVGGVNIVNTLDNAELYDPSAGTWTRTSSSTTFRFDHTATLLATGNVLVAGGAYAGFVANTALYDPATDTWSNTDYLLPARAAHQVTLLQDGRVLVTGGTNDADMSFGLPNADLYDPAVNAWRRAPDLHVPRLGHSATLLPDGRVLVAGGDSVEGCAECTHGAFPANNTAELFDPAVASWSNVGGLNTGRSGHTATLLPNGEVLVAGGYNFIPPNSGAITKKAERYEASSALWHQTSDLNAARSGHTATLLPNGKVLVVGGYGAGGVLNSAELYGPVPPGTIVPAFTGSWFDPAQNGHGLLIEVLPNNQFLAAWFAFNPAGSAQAWFTGIGTYSGDTAIISNVLQPTGGRWIPNFDPDRIVDSPWGTLKFTFTDCNHGKVDFSSTQPGYGSGSMNLTRLTQPAGPGCP